MKFLDTPEKVARYLVSIGRCGDDEGFEKCAAEIRAEFPDANAEELLHYEMAVQINEHLDEQEAIAAEHAAAREAEHDSEKSMHRRQP